MYTQWECHIKLYGMYSIKYIPYNCNLGVSENWVQYTPGCGPFKV